MSAAEALRAARATGIELRVDGDDLVLEASEPPPTAVLDLLSRHKVGVMALLRPIKEVSRSFDLGSNPAGSSGGAQIKTLFFGHEIRGREVVSGGTIGWIEGDLLCTVLRTRPLQCRAVYRNPAGTFAGQNEYLYFRDVDRFEFSVVK